VIRRWLVPALCGFALGWCAARALTVHREYAARAVVTRPLVVSTTAGMLLDSLGVLAQRHGWHVVGFTLLLPRNGKGMQIHVEPVESIDSQVQP